MEGSSGLPGWEIHWKTYEVLGLNTSICRIIDNIVDKEPPRASEVLPYVREGIVLPIHFGSKKGEFPYMYNYVAKKYGVEGAKCLLTHFILDHIENTLLRGYDTEMVADEVKALIKEYQDECRIAEEKCIYLEEAFNHIMGKLEDKLADTIMLVKQWLDEKTLPLELLLNASNELLSLTLRLKLYIKGYKGKTPGFSVSQEAFRKTYGKAKRLLRIEAYKALVNREIKDIQGIIKSINNIKKKTRNKTTISKYLDKVKEERRNNKEFDKYINIITNVCTKVVKEYEEAGRT